MVKESSKGTKGWYVIVMEKKKGAEDKNPGGDNDQGR